MRGLGFYSKVSFGAAVPARRPNKSASRTVPALGVSRAAKRLPGCSVVRQRGCEHGAQSLRINVLPRSYWVAGRIEQAASVLLDCVFVLWFPSLMAFYVLSALLLGQAQRGYSARKSQLLARP